MNRIIIRITNRITPFIVIHIRNNAAIYYSDLFGLFEYIAHACALVVVVVALQYDFQVHGIGLHFFC